MGKGGKKRGVIPKKYQTGNFAMDAAKRYLYGKIDQLTPQIYSAFALVLHENHGWDAEQIATLFAETQSLWAESAADGRNMAQICLDEIGIDVRAGSERGINGAEDFIVYGGGEE